MLAARCPHRLLHSPTRYGQELASAGTPMPDEAAKAARPQQLRLRRLDEPSLPTCPCRDREGVKNRRTTRRSSLRKAETSDFLEFWRVGLRADRLDSIVSHLLTPYAVPGIRLDGGKRGVLASLARVTEHQPQPAGCMALPRRPRACGGAGAQSGSGRKRGIVPPQRARRSAGQQERPTA
jgi:hypothetical protein